MIAAAQRRTAGSFRRTASDRAFVAIDFVRAGDPATSFRFRPVCGSTVFHTEEGRDGSVSVAVGAFADPSFPAPEDSVYDGRRHPWVRLPSGIVAYDKDPA